VNNGRAIVLGDFATGGPQAVSEAEVGLRALEFVTHWRRCGLTADWLATFVAYDSEPEVRDNARSVLSTVINELVENAAKFCADKRQHIRIVVRHHGDFIRVETTNGADTARVDAFRTALSELEHTDLDELFTDRIQRQREPSVPGIGLIILKKDYRARIGARLAEGDGGIWDVQVQATVDVQEVEGR